MGKVVNEKIILGMDPGTNEMGYGIIIVNGSQLTLQQFGVIHLRKYTTHELKLKKIFENVTSLLNRHKPDEVAIEAPFYGKNVQSMLKLGRAQGVAMAAVLSHGLPIVEYAPKKIKQSVTGNGNASKEQVAHMLRHILSFDEMPKLFDATDALAAAVCHHFSKGSKGRQKKSWSAFIKNNPGRVAGQ